MFDLCINDIILWASKPTKLKGDSPLGAAADLEGRLQLIVPLLSRDYNWHTKSRAGPLFSIEIW